VRRGAGRRRPGRGRGHETRLLDTLDPRDAVHLDDAEVATTALATLHADDEDLHGRAC
jgi:UDP-N-acetylmuramoyl-L-alanyl-D-glutamate--2,6-diaminopimelate ligase